MRSSVRIGILGGGQLGSFLDQAARGLAGREGLALTSVVMTDDVASPAEKAGAEILRGSPNRIDDLVRLFGTTTHVVIENEFLDADLLEEAQARAGGAKIQPSLYALRLAQDKLVQKKLLEGANLPTAKFAELPSSTGADDGAFARVAGDFRESGFVLKASRGGYDGRGNFAVRPGQAPAPDAAREFLTRFRDVPVYAEEWVPFAFECALVACRSGSELHAYPLVRTTQRNGTCEWVMPLALPERESLEREARGLAKKIAHLFGLEGVFAVEFFAVTAASGEPGLLINEIAPRVHNSGHFTLDAAPVSQFEAHVRSALELPLADADFETLPSFAMMNILGPPQATGPASRSAIPVAVPEHLREYWYGKEELRPMRKLGHWNAVSARPGEAPRLAREMELLSREFYRGLLDQVMRGPTS